MNPLNHSSFRKAFLGAHLARHRQNDGTRFRSCVALRSPPSRIFGRRTE
jgi:hypothetical protein